MRMRRNTKDTQLQIRLSSGQKRLIEREAGKAGATVSEWVLGRLISAPGQAFQELVANLAVSQSEQPVWAAMMTCLKVFRRWISLRRFPLPAESSPRRANTLAAMVEHAVRLKGTRPPAWVAEIKPLDSPWFGSDLVSLKPYLLVHSPVEFRRRNPSVDSSVGQRV